MRGAFQIVRLFGIPVKIHWTFLLLLLWGVYLVQTVPDRMRWDVVGWAVIGLITLFSCVVLHEFGHALTARRFGIATRDIILLPIGGLAMLTKLPDRPVEELLIAIAGPMVNFVIAILCLPYFFLVPAIKREGLLNLFWSLLNPRSNIFAENITAVDWFVVGLLTLNLMVALFNLLPAFPMDGGRIFRALLSLRLGRLKATRIAAFVGQFFAVLLFAYSLYQGNWLAILIAVFVFITAANEYRAIRQEALLQKKKVKELVRRSFSRLYMTDTIQEALDICSRGSERYYLVFDEWHQVRAVLDEEELIKRSKEYGTAAKLKDFLKTQFEALLAEDSLRFAQQEMYFNGQQVFPVFEKEKLLGILDEDQLRHYLRFREKLEVK